MPIIVDHAERRDLIASVVKKMVAEHGMEHVTLRNVAREAGFSTTIVSHYFRDKQDLLAYAYSTVRTTGAERVQGAFAAGGDLVDCLAVLLPANEEMLRDWQAWFGFWGTVTSDPVLAAERLAGADETQKLFSWLIEGAKLRGELPARLDTPFHAHRLQMLLNGLASLVIMKPDDWPPSAQREVLAWHVDVIKQIYKTAE